MDLCSLILQYVLNLHNIKDGVTLIYFLQHLFSLLDD